MKENWWGMLLVLGIAFALFGISYFRKRRIEPSLDAFATAYCEVADHILGDARALQDAWFATETTADGLFRLAPVERQPMALQRLFTAGVDDYAMERLRTMFRQRSQAQDALSGINMLSKRINPVLNNTYDLVNEFLSLLHQPDVTFDQKSLDRFHYFLHKQQHIRGVALASIVSNGYRQTFLGS